MVCEGVVACVVAFVSEAGGIVATWIGVVGCKSAGEDSLDDGVRDGGGSDGIVSMSPSPYMSLSLPCSSPSFSSSFSSSESLPLSESEGVVHWPAALLLLLDVAWSPVADSSKSNSEELMAR